MQLRVDCKFWGFSRPLLSNYDLPLGAETKKNAPSSNFKQFLIEINVKITKYTHCNSRVYKFPTPGRSGHLRFIP
jgi:hypothetical protein